MSQENEQEKEKTMEKKEVIIYLLTENKKTKRRIKMSNNLDFNEFKNKIKQKINI